LAGRRSKEAIPTLFLTAPALVAVIGTAQAEETTRRGAVVRTTARIAAIDLTVFVNFVSKLDTELMAVSRYSPPASPIPLRF
jgi:hypothetical protein